MSYPERPFYQRPSGPHRPGLSSGRVLDDGNPHMRRIGLVMCVASATITLVSAMLIAIRL